MWHCIVGDRWRVVLKGDLKNYIHAVFVNVCTWEGIFKVHCLYLTLTVVCVGLQAAENFHHSSKSHAIHLQRFLEDGS